MGTDRQGRFGEDPFQRLLFIDEQVSGTAANEDFDSRCPFDRLQNLKVVRCRADVKSVIDARFLRGQLQLVFQRG